MAKSRKKTSQVSAPAQTEVNASVPSADANPNVLIDDVDKLLQSMETGATNAIPELPDAGPLGDGGGEILEPMDAAGGEAGDEIIEQPGETDGQPQSADEKLMHELLEQTLQAADAAVEGQPGETPPEAPAQTTKSTRPPAHRAPRVTFHGNRKSAVLDNRLNGQTADFLVLEDSDALLEPDALAAKQKALKEELDTKVAKKVAEKCIMLFKWAKHGGALNEVMKAAFTVLARDGELTSGQKGNLQTELLKKYSAGTSASQANQMFMLFPFLKITVKGAKGQMVVNPQSVIFAKAVQSLGLTVRG